MNRIRVLLIGLASALLVGGLLAPPTHAAPVWLTSRITWTNPDLAPSSPPPRVVNLRYGHHEGFDRVVIGIRASLPGGRASYHRNFTYDGSGKPVPIKGRSGLRLALQPAYAHDDEGTNLYRGPRIARPRFETLKAVAFTGDFEGVVSFAFALRHHASYRVFTLNEPRRIVIDFRHRD
jgi:hypothetical protein